MLLEKVNPKMSEEEVNHRVRYENPETVNKSRMKEKFTLFSLNKFSPDSGPE